MLTLSNLSLRRDSNELLRDVNLSIKPKQRVGLIGRNGCGKSSLFALILKQIDADHGECLLSSHCQIAHLAQETPALQQAAIEYVMDGDKELREIEAELAKAEQDNDGEHIAHCHERLQHIDGYSARSRAAQLLNGLGFQDDETTKPVAEFSGGWRIRLNLAQALMCRSDLLLLDEPTNHLDLDALLWLERWLKCYAGTLLLISHDRDFLDSVATHIAHAEHKTIKFYTGNYSAFENTRAEQLALQQKMFEKQQKQRAHLQSYVDRFRYKASKAKQAQSRIKQLEKMEFIAAAHVDSEFSFEFFEPKSATNPLLSLEDVAVGYDADPVLTHINLSLAPGDRVGVLGPNGAGKSTFIKMLAKELELMHGTYESTKALNIGYFAQHQLEQLKLGRSCLDHMHELAPNEKPQALRSYLGRFNFIGDKALEPIDHFSGGEKARLALALMIWQKPNLLLLDEPTNHFDLDMRQALTLALQDFKGAVIVISHDRFLLKATTEDLLLVYNGQVSPFVGDVDDYQQWLFDRESFNKAQTPTVDSSSNKKQQRIDAATQREQEKPLRDRIKVLDKQLEKLQKQANDIEDKLHDSSLYEEANKDKLMQLLQHQSDIKTSITATEEEWFELQEKLS